MTIETHDAATAVQPRCSFCARPNSEVDKVIAGPGVYICNVCVGKCNDVLAAESRKSADPKAQLAEPTAQLAAWGESIPRIAAVGTQTEASIQRLIAILRNRRITWARIGSALQITRQSAWERFSGEE
jgi:ATP-dependent Clp protease ATP-binding subunit ClpX